MKLLSKNARIKSNILWPKMSRHVNKALRSVTIKLSKVKNRENQIRDLKIRLWQLKINLRSPPPSRDPEILGWRQPGPVLPHGEVSV